LIAKLQVGLHRLLELRDAKKDLGVEESPEDADNITEQHFLINRLRTEPYRRWSNGFTCLCFALIGIPVAMLWRHADVLTNFFVCFLPILSIYYPLLLYSDYLTATTGILPPFCFWMGNVVLCLPGIALMRWIVRH
jgi:lipopolysaccharide export system permease protein